MNDLVHALIQPGTAISGGLAGVVGLFVIWMRGQLKGMTMRIISLEDKVDKCQGHRVNDARELGRMEAEIAILQRTVERHSGAPTVMRVIADSQGMILSVTRSVETLLGYHPDQLIGRNISILMAEDVRSQHEAAFAARVADPTIKSDAVIVRMSHARHAVGGSIPVRITLHEEAVEGGKQFIADIARIDLPVGK